MQYKCRLSKYKSRCGSKRQVSWVVWKGFSSGTMGGPRGRTGGPDAPPPEKSQKNIRFLSNTGSDPLKKTQSYQASIQCWAIVGHLKGVSLAGRWWPIYSDIWILYPLKNYKNWSPSDKTFWIRAWELWLYNRTSWFMTENYWAWTWNPSVTNQVTLLQSSPCFDIFLCLIKVHTSLRFSKKLDNFKTFSRDLTIPHLDLSHFALCIMGN